MKEGLVIKMEDYDSLAVIAEIVLRMQGNNRFAG